MGQPEFRRGKLSTLSDRALIASQLASPHLHGCHTTFSEHNAALDHLRVVGLGTRLLEGLHVIVAGRAGAELDRRGTGLGKEDATANHLWVVLGGAGALELSNVIVGSGACAELHAGEVPLCGQSESGLTDALGVIGLGSCISVSEERKTSPTRREATSLRQIFVPELSLYPISTRSLPDGLSQN